MAPCLRLFPALFVALTVWAAWTLYEGTDPFAVAKTVFFVVAYGVNLVIAFCGFSALAGFGQAWSLSAEEQFYLVWPTLLWLSLRKGLTSRQIACFLLAALATVNAYRPFLWSGHDSWVRLYFGPDTHADPILVGCALALLVEGKQVVMIGSKAVALAVLLWVHPYASLVGL